MWAFFRTFARDTIMKKFKQRTYLIFLLMLFSTLKAVAQFVQGSINDSKTGEPLPGVHIFYQEDTKVGAISLNDGTYKIPARKGRLVFSMIGYDSQIIRVAEAKKLNVKMVESVNALREVEIKTKRGHYSRKDNPAVEFMRKVIDAKKEVDLHRNDYFSYTKYEKMTTSLNEFTPKVFEDNHFKRMPFLKDHVEICKETGKLILPLVIEEKVSQHIFRKNPRSEKDIILGQRNDGVNELFNTGDIVTTMLADCFTDIDIYKDDVRLFQYPFTSPISKVNAIRFYRYYLTDTLVVNNEPCVQVDFTPNNPQDFGFSGTLWITADSTYRVKRIHLGVPRRSDVNFIERLDIYQDFSQLDNGDQVMTDSKMLVQLKLANFIQKAQVERTLRYSNFNFDEIPDRTFNFGGNTKLDGSAHMKDEDFWNIHRPEPLTHSENKMDLLMKRLMDIKGFKEIIWVAKAFIENFVETSIDPKKPSKFDIGPVNTTFTQNFVEGFKLRASGQTTANLSPHWFAKGYVGYGFKDKRWKGSAELTYAINKKDYLPREFPKNNITAQYYYDVIAPADRFIQTDKDNVFSSLKWTTQDHMSYVQRFQLQYDREWYNGMRLYATARRERTEAAGNLIYQPLHTTSIDGSPRMDYLTPQTLPDGTQTLVYNAMPQMTENWRKDLDYNKKYLVTTDLCVGFQYEPGVTWINTKQRRIKMNKDAPIVGFSHTIGFKGLLGGEYNYNLTEVTLYKRFWLRTWGKMDIYVKSQCQWNKVPFPMLCYPVANLSYIMHDLTFNLVNNMEFINDRNATVRLSWDLNGKLFNRIPGFRRLKLREFIGCNMYFGYLSDKNNPFLAKNANDARLYYFPGRFESDGSFKYTSQQLDWYRPYVEVMVGIHNIFKILHVEYVHRINYLQKDTQKWGIRFTFRTQF